MRDRRKTEGPQQKAISPGRNVLRLEVNILTFPLFALERDRVGQPGHIHCRIRKRDEELLWVVSGHKSPPDVAASLRRSFGLPGPFDKDIFYAVIWDIEENHPKPFHDPYLIRSWRHILDLAQKAYTSENIEAAKTALRRLSAITVYQSNAFFVKDTGRYRQAESIFRPFTRVLIRGERDEKGELLEDSMVFFDPLLLSNINNRYVKPINFELYMGLERPLARRIFEVLDSRFYALQKRKQKRVNFRYSTLCQLLPSKQQLHYSLARRVFDRAFDELYRKEFLSNVQWAKTDEKHDWIINYFPGRTAGGDQDIHDASPDSIKYRARLIKRLKRYFPDYSFPHDIPDERLDYFLYKVEQGEVMPGRVISPVAYMKSLSVESFPTLFEREERARRIDQKRRAEAERRMAFETEREEDREEMLRMIREFNENLF